MFFSAGRGACLFVELARRMCVDFRAVVDLDDAGVTGDSRWRKLGLMKSWLLAVECAPGNSWKALECARKAGRLVRAAY